MTPSRKRISPNSQRAALMDYFKSGRALTTLTALGTMGVGSLSSRVAELRKAGHNIVGEFKKDANGKRYKSYTLGNAA